MKGTALWVFPIAGYFGYRLVAPSRGTGIFNIVEILAVIASYSHPFLQFFNF